jgi:hypothetical protein
VRRNLRFLERLRSKKKRLAEKLRSYKRERLRDSLHVANYVSLEIRSVLV